MTFGSLFAGIGGFDLGLEAAGMQCRWQVEIDEFANHVLENHWPDVERHGDVKTFSPSYESEWKVDVICGGFPCQDISTAGTGFGLDGDRSGLWSEYVRIISGIRPKYVIVENVSALLIRGIDRVLRDLATLGYDAEWQTVFASDFEMPHRRERIFIVAYPNEKFWGERQGMGDKSQRPESLFKASSGECVSIRVQTADRFIGVDDGISRESYSYRASSLGNAVIPAIAQWIGQLILEHSK